MKSSEIAELTWYSLRNHEVEATPGNYRLWYMHHAGWDARLSERIARLLAEGARFDEACMRMLHQVFMPDMPEQAMLRESTVRLHALASHMGEAAAAGSAATAQFDTALRTFGAELESGTGDGGLAEIRAAAAREHQRNRELCDRLTAAEIQLSEMRKTLDAAEQAAGIDALTGLINRRRFDAVLAEQLAECRRDGTPSSLIMADIDLFKQFNDRFGHQTGDLVLRAVSRTLRDCVKGRDCVARHGGEEFAILLVGADLAGGLAVAEGIRHALSRRRLVNRASGASLGVISMSLGVAQYRAGDTPEALRERADQAMYRAKRNGRNRVECDAVPMFAPG